MRISHVVLALATVSTLACSSAATAPEVPATTTELGKVVVTPLAAELTIPHNYLNGVNEGHICVRTEASVNLVEATVSNTFAGIGELYLLPSDRDCGPGMHSYDMLVMVYAITRPATATVTIAYRYRPSDLEEKQSFKVTVQ